MRRILRILSVALLCAPIASFAATGTATWTNPTQTVCPQTSPKSCVKGATLTDITSIPVVVISAAIAQGTTSYTFAGPTDGAVHSYSLVYNGYDNNGNAVTSTAATATAQAPFTLAPPTNFTVTIQ